MLIGQMDILEYIGERTGLVVSGRSVTRFMQDCWLMHRTDLGKSLRFPIPWNTFKNYVQRLVPKRILYPFHSQNIM